MITHGDCYDVMYNMDDNSISAIVTDPPYGLKFMGKDWDHGIPGVKYWEQALRICKPGAFLLAFGGTRTFHRLTCAIEDAGWEIRDCISYLYGSGFPKGHDFPWKMHLQASEICGNMVVNEKEIYSQSSPEYQLRFVRSSYIQTEVYSCHKCGQVLQPFVPKQSLQEHRTAWSKSKTFWNQQSIVERWNNSQESQGELQRCEICKMSHGIFADGAERWIHSSTQINNGPIPWQIIEENGSYPSYRPQSIEQYHPQLDAFLIECRAQTLRGFNTTLKPAWEPIIMAMKPCDGTFKQNAEKWGQAGINIEDSRVDDKRWPANLILDEFSSQMLDEQSGLNKSKRSFRGKVEIFKKENSWIGTSTQRGHDDSGGASRFFYCAKASSRERNDGLEGLELKKCSSKQVNSKDRYENGNSTNQRPSEPIRQNNHPTVKPLKLMEYLIKLIMPPKDGILLDPFAGSGTTILAAKNLGYEAIGIEKDEGYCEIARKRLENTL